MGRFDRENLSAEGLPASLGTATEELRATVERQVREIVESAEGRAAAIEDQALERAAQLERESHDRATELFHTSVERSDRMLEAIDALEREIGAVIGLLREEAQTLAAELKAGKVTHTEPARFDGLANEAIEDPAGEPATRETVAGEETESEETTDQPSGNAEVRGMIHQQVSILHETGKSREDAEAFLLRFKHGESYLDILDEVYGEVPSEAGEAKPSPSRRRRLRRRRAKQHGAQQ
jgi:hypothetical protein